MEALVFGTTSVHVQWDGLERNASYVCLKYLKEIL